MFDLLLYRSCSKNDREFRISVPVLGPSRKAQWSHLCELPGLCFNRERPKKIGWRSHIGTLAQNLQLTAAQVRHLEAAVSKRSSRA
jgi:hypothetical protein